MIKQVQVENDNPECIERDGGRFQIKFSGKGQTVSVEQGWKEDLVYNLIGYL